MSFEDSSKKFNLLASVSKFDKSVVDTYNVNTVQNDDAIEPDISDNLDDIDENENAQYNIEKVIDPPAKPSNISFDFGDEAVNTDKTNFFGISNYFMPTEQSQLFKDNFPPEVVRQSPEFMDSLNSLASKIKSRYSYPGGAAQRLGLLDKSISKEERIKIILGYLWQAMEAALGENRRIYEYAAQGDLRDSRLAIFVNNEDLVPDHLRGSWEDVKKSWDYALRLSTQKDQARYDKDVQKALAQGYTKEDIVNTKEDSHLPGKFYVRPVKKSITGPTKEKLLASYAGGKLANDLQEHLSELLKARDQRVLPGILRRAEDIAAYVAYKDFPQQEQSMPKDMVEEGEAGEFDVLDPVDKFNKTVVDRSESRMSPEERINSVRDGTVLVNDFMNEMKDVMGTYVDSLSGVSQKTKDSAIGAVDLVSLKSALFKRQVSDLFSNATFLRKPEEVKDPELRKLLKLMDNSEKSTSPVDQKEIDSILEKLAPGEVYATPVGIFNNIGGIRWKKTNKSDYENQMANAVSPKVTTQYNNLLYQMKTDIKSIAEKLQVQGLDSSEDFYDRIRKTVSSNPVYQDPTLAKFLNDDNFVRHTLEQSQKYIDARSNLNTQKYLSQSGFVWGKLAADALIAFIRGKGKLEKEISTLMPGEREKRIRDFQIARQNFLTFIRFHASLGPKPEGSPKDKVGGHAKLKGILEDIGPGLYKELGINKLNGRDMISMIAGGPLPPRLKQIFTLLESKLSRWEGYKQAVAIYVNMMTKISKLRKMNGKMIRISSSPESVKNMHDKMDDIYIRGMFMIRQLLG
jgi:hypothetical protein